MLEFENTIRIDRPVGEVFAFLSDFENGARYGACLLVDVSQVRAHAVGDRALIRRAQRR